MADDSRLMEALLATGAVTLLFVGVSYVLSLGHTLTQEPNPYLDLRMTFVTVPVALAVLAYMRRLSRQARLV